MNMHMVMEGLAKSRPVFHSEADFQHALAWQLHELAPEAELRLEYRPTMPERIYLDVWFRKETAPSAIELKYVSKRLEVESAGERFDLSNHGAQDLRRYDFIKDVARLERVVESIPGASGTAIFLTNDPSYWSALKRNLQIDAAFRLQEGRVLNGTLAWASNAGTRTMQGREQPLSLNNSYPVTWHDYSNVNAITGRFRYLLIEVPARPS